jgi:hypothetical protein
MMSVLTINLMKKLFLPANAAALILLVGAGGCCTSKQHQLESVARDWCMTIRASQVIPIYPLTEDVQPGDIFLVQTPIDKQQDDYNKKGFLALDNLIARLNPTGYSNFYAKSFLYTNEEATLPHDWTASPLTNWERAPRAGFPSYSFSVKHGVGMNLAVPIDGVPVGLSLMNSDAADGTVSLEQARTIGVDTISLWNQVQLWGQDNSGFLGQYGPAEGQTNYVRVITRVYACGQMNVNLRDASSQSGGLDVGAAKPVNLLFPQLSTNTTATVVETYTNQLNTLQSYTNGLNALQSSLPGGSLRLAAASSRSVSLVQTFVPPLIIGYLGFDCEIMDNGSLGPPIPTHARLESNSQVHQGVLLPVPTQAEIEIVRELTAKVGQLKTGGDTAAAKAILARLGKPCGPKDDPFERLQDAVREGALEHSKLPKLKDAFGI